MSRRVALINAARDRVAKQRGTVTAVLELEELEELDELEEKKPSRKKPSRKTPSRKKEPTP